MMNCLILIDVENLENDVISNIVNSAISTSCLIVEISKNPIL